MLSLELASSDLSEDLGNLSIGLEVRHGLKLLALPLVKVAESKADPETKLGDGDSRDLSVIWKRVNEENGAVGLFLARCKAKDVLHVVCALNAGGGDTDLLDVLADWWISGNSEPPTKDLGIAVLHNFAFELVNAEGRVDEVVDAGLLDLVDGVGGLLDLLLGAFFGVVVFGITAVPLPPWG